LSKLEICKLYNEECGKEINVLFVDDQMFDYMIDEDSLRSASIYCNKNPNLKKAVHGDIMKHFVDSFSEFIGRPVTLDQICQGIEAGEMECTS